MDVPIEHREEEEGKVSEVLEDEWIDRNRTEWKRIRGHQREFYGSIF